MHLMMPIGTRACVKACSCALTFPHSSDLKCGQKWDVRCVNLCCTAVVPKHSHILGRRPFAKIITHQTDNKGNHNPSSWQQKSRMGKCSTPFYSLLEVTWPNENIYLTSGSNIKMRYTAPLWHDLTQYFCPRMLVFTTCSILVAPQLGQGVVSACRLISDKPSYRQTGISTLCAGRPLFLQ